MNWRESLVIAIRHGRYAKGAKASPVTDDEGLLHLLHTNYPVAQGGNSPGERPAQVRTGREFEQPKEPEPLEDVLKGRAIELWSDAAGRLFIVADEDDTRRLGEPRGTVYTAAEMRRVVHIGDPAIVLEIHEWKRKVNGCLRDYKAETESA